MAGRALFVVLPFERRGREMTAQETRFWQGQWLRRLDAGRARAAVSAHGLVPFESTEVPFTGIYLLGFFRDAGWEVGILDLGELESGAVESRLAATPADVYLFSPFTTDYAFVRFLLPLIRACHPEAVCVAGGHHVSARVAEALTDGFDFVVPGRAEGALAQMAALGCERPERIAGAIYLDGGGRPTGGGPSGAAPDDVPIPAYEALPNRFRRSYYTRLFTSHGCPFHCVFCSSRLWTRTRPVFKSAARIARELSLVREYVEFEEVYVGDETFTVKQRHALDVAELLHDAGVAWGAETRLDLVRPETMRALGRMGCREMDFGLESLSPEVLRRADKRINPAKAGDALAATREAGIRTHVNLMIGLPGETEDTARATVDTVCGWMRQGLVTTVDYFITVPYPGSDLFEQPERFGITLRTKDWNRYRENDLPVYDLDTLDAERIYGLWLDGLERFADVAGA